MGFKLYIILKQILSCECEMKQVTLSQNMNGKLGSGQIAFPEREKL